MGVAFNRMPGNLRVPLFYAEVNSGLNFFSGNSKLLLIGQMLSTGSATPNVPILIQLNNIDALFGQGSMLCDMIRIAARNNPLGEIWALPLADPAGTQATATITVSETLTPGIAVVYVAGQKYAVSVTSADTPTTIAAALAAAINAAYVNIQGASVLAPVTASASNGVITLTARHKGLLGNLIEVDNDLVGDEGPNAANIAIVPFSGVAAAGVIQMPTNPTASQTLTIGGTVITFVSSGTTGNQVNIGESAAATVAALLAFLQASTDTNIAKAKYVADASVATSIDVTYGQVGTVGNSFAISTTVTGATVPATLSGGAGNAGAGTPSLTAGLAACGSTPFDMIACPYSDATSLNTLQAFLNDSGGRWDPTIDLYGIAFTVAFGNLLTLATLGTGRNDPNVSIMGVQASPSPPWSWAAAIAAQVQLHKNLGADLSQSGEISRPMQTLILEGILPPKSPSLDWQTSNLQALYFDGISGFFRRPDGKVAVSRLISTYQTNAWGSPDTTWLDIDTRYQTAYALRYLRQVITQTYPRSALVPDNPSGLQGFTTPTDIKGTIIHAYNKLCSAGVMKNPDLFAQNLIVEQAADPNRVNAYLPFDVANQLRIFAANATTFLNAAAN